VATNRQLWLVSSTLFLSTLGFGLTLPALPFFVERMALGPDAPEFRITFHVGMLTSIYALSQVLLGPLIGAWSDRWGRRPLLLVGLLGFAFAQGLFGLGTSLPVLYAARFAAGASAAALLTASSAMVVDIFDREDRIRGMAWIGTAASLGLVVGPAMSGLLSRGGMHGHRMVGYLMLDGFSIPFLVASAFALLALAPIALWLDESTPTTAHETRSVPGRAGIADLLVLSAAGQLAFASFEAIFALYGRAVLSLGPRAIGWGFVTCGLVMALFQGGLVGVVGDRIDARLQLSFGFAALAGGLVALGFVSGLGAALGSIAVLALGVAIITPNLTAAIAARRLHAPGSAIGLQNTANGIGQVVGPAAGSLLFAVNAQLPFLIASALSFALAAWLLLRWDPSPAKPSGF
jgi:MFS family permease